MELKIFVNLPFGRQVRGKIHNSAFITNNYPQAFLYDAQYDKLST